MFNVRDNVEAINSIYRGKTRKSIPPGERGTVIEAMDDIFLVRFSEDEDCEMWVAASEIRFVSRRKEI